MKSVLVIITTVVNHQTVGAPDIRSFTNVESARSAMRNEVESMIDSGDWTERSSLRNDNLAVVDSIRDLEKECYNVFEIQTIEHATNPTNLEDLVETLSDAGVHSETDMINVLQDGEALANLGITDQDAVEALYNQIMSRE